MATSFGGVLPMATLRTRLLGFGSACLGVSPPWEIEMAEIEMAEIEMAEIEMAEIEMAEIGHRAGAAPPEWDGPSPHTCICAYDACAHACVVPAHTRRCGAARMGWAHSAQRRAQAQSDRIYRHSAP